MPAPHSPAVGWGPHRSGQRGRGRSAGGSSEDALRGPVTIGRRIDAGLFHARPRSVQAGRSHGCLGCSVGLVTRVRFPCPTPAGEAAGWSERSERGLAAVSSDVGGRPRGSLARPLLGSRSPAAPGSGSRRLGLGDLGEEDGWVWGWVASGERVARWVRPQGAQKSRPMPLKPPREGQALASAIERLRRSPAWQGWHRARGRRRR